MSFSRIIKRIILVLFFIILLLNNNTVLAQYYDTGQDPFKLKWYQINTENFQIIFPKSSEKQAQHLANSLTSVYKRGGLSLNHQPKKIPVILHNQSVVSNGMVAWAPKGMQIYTCPPQNIYSQDWIDQLATHEFRHVVQIDKLNHGFSKFLYYIFGQQAIGAVIGLYVPRWFLEGDAVCTETALSNSGRGRLPSFEMELKSQVLTKGIYSYRKAVFGSYKDFVPNYYKLGYHIVANSRKKYGTQIWSNALDNVAKRPFLFNPIPLSIKKTTGYNYKKFYSQNLIELDSLWREQQKKINFSDFKIVNKNKKGKYVNYESPNFINHSLIIAEKTSLDNIKTFVKIDDKGSEKVLFKPGIKNNKDLSFAKNIVVWAEIKNDLRWSNKNYSEIKSYNINTKQKKSITKKSRLFSPVISPNAEKIVAVKVTVQNEYSIAIIDLKSDKITKEIKLPPNNFIISPSWNNDSKTLVCILLSNKGKCIATVNTVNSKVKYLTEYSFDEISKPVFLKKYILFSAAYSGIDNIYALDTLSRNIFQITSSQYGASSPNVSDDNKQIIYSDYSAQGKQIAIIKVDTSKWISLENVSDNSIKLYEDIAKQENGAIDFNHNNDINFDIKKFSRLKNLLDVHSWSPLFINVDNYNISPGFSILSQNKLSTAFIDLGYDFNLNQTVGKYHLGFIYKGFYPIIDTKFNYGEKLDVDQNQNTITVNEISMSTGIKLPLNISKGKYYRKLQSSVKYDYFKTFSQESANYIRHTFNGMSYSLYTYNIIKTSKKDIYPRWGQILNLNFRNTSFDNTDSSSIFSASSVCYFPGLFNHHGIRIYGGFQKKNIDFFRYSDLVNYPRGYYNQFNDELYSVSLTYKFPILYPDYDLSFLAYIKRVKMALFFDYAQGVYNSESNYYKSTGVELTSDFHIFRFLVPLEFGIGCYYKPETNTFFNKILFSMNLEF
ncbi:MAG: hypothetical protein DRJ01_02055 [Bacteroidetes bacterium]|nr:MAG: hypothetical protein DRJ01_02055 [Bacteroidota bacterium]